MEIGNQYVNYASLKNWREIRGQGKPQIPKKRGGGGGVSLDKREKKKKMWILEVIEGL